MAFKSEGVQLENVLVDIEIFLLIWQKISALKLSFTVSLKWIFRTFEPFFNILKENLEIILDGVYENYNRLVRFLVGYFT